MQTAAFEALGIDDRWSYRALDLAPEDFAAGVRELADRGFKGVNVTVPHKRAAFELADQCSDAVSEIGAANTLTFQTNGIRADNTDASGLIAALPAGLELSGKRALVLGAGGSARAGAWALSRAGAAVSIANRSAEKAQRLASELGIVAIDLPAAGAGIDLIGFDLLVNATAVGLAREGAERPRAGVDLKALRLRADQLIDPLVVVDLVYGTEPTELAAKCMSGGATIVDGLEILVCQGAESFRIWTGLEPPTEIMRDAVRKQQRSPR